MAVRKLPHMSACFHTFPENTLTALEEVLQMIRRKCGTDNPGPRKICTQRHIYHVQSYMILPDSLIYKIIIKCILKHWT